MVIYLFLMLVIAILAALLLSKSPGALKVESLRGVLYCLMLLTAMVIILIFVNAFRLSLG